MSEKKCKTEECERRATVRGMCNTCYIYWWRSEHPGRHYEVNKTWRKRHPKRRYTQRARYYRKHQSYAVNKDQPYDDFDDQMILDRVILDKSGEIIQTGVCDVSLAKHLGRSVGAIQGHRGRIKKALKKKTSVA